MSSCSKETADVSQWTLRKSSSSPRRRGRPLAPCPVRCVSPDFQDVSTRSSPRRNASSRKSAPVATVAGWWSRIRVPCPQGSRARLPKAQKAWDLPSYLSRYIKSHSEAWGCPLPVAAGSGQHACGCLSPSRPGCALPFRQGRRISDFLCVTTRLGCGRRHLLFRQLTVFSSQAIVSCLLRAKLRRTQRRRNRAIPEAARLCSSALGNVFGRAPATAVLARPRC